MKQGKKYCQRANYQCKIWHLGLEAEQNYNSPVNYGRMHFQDRNIVREWMDCDPTP